MLPTIQGHLYDYPKYYDLVYGSDWKAEFDFLIECFDRYADSKVRKVFEPACGTGRLLVKLAQAGFEASGLDLNAKAIAYCNRRLARYGFDESTFVGDMADFRLPRKIDAAFNMINSFRHLLDESAAVNHLRSVAAALRKGGIYVLGLHLTPTSLPPMQEESWPARRGNLSVISHLWVVDTNLQLREERVGMCFDVYTPTRQFRIEDEIVFRTYTADQMKLLISRVAEFEIRAIHDFGYNVERPVRITGATEDVVFVLRKR